MPHLNILAWTSAALALSLVAAAAQDGGVVPDGIRFQDLPYDGRTLTTGIDLTDPAVLQSLGERGAFFVQDDPAAFLNQDRFFVPDEATTIGAPLPPGENPAFDQEIWDRLREMGPYLMPVDEDESSPVPLTSLGGAGVALGDPSDLALAGSASGAGCQRPAVVDPVIGLRVNAARLATVLITPVSRLDVAADGTGAVFRYPKCSDDAAAVPPAHCSGLVEADGRTVWTAHHCVASPALGLVGPGLQGLQVGQSGPCDAATALRVVSVVGLVSGDQRIPASLIAGCDSVTRVARDVVRVQLSQPLPVAYGDGVAVADWRFPRDGELGALLVADRLLYGAGYLHSAVLHDMPGGRLMPVETCAVTLAGLLPRFDGLAVPADLAAAATALLAGTGTGAMSHGGFACISTDTFNGGSGGPVFAIDDTGRDLVLIGLVSGAAWADFDMECQQTAPNPLTAACGSLPDGRLNILALLPEPAARP